MTWKAHFKRKTNTTAFIPQIDGLRFVAIVMVLLFHINLFVTSKIPFAFSRPAADSWWLFRFLDSNRKGVLLFFVISGFILALPFAKAAREQGKPVELKRYYLRRLTRLEPPYFATKPMAIAPQKSLTVTFTTNWVRQFVKAKSSR